VKTKIYLYILASSFGLMILGSVIGGILESSGTVTRESLGARGVAMVLMVYFALFCLAAFALVPVVLRAFIAMQIKIGNGEFFLVKWLQTYEQGVVYGVWGFFAAGLGIAYFLVKDLVMKNPG
jgi:dolichyl-phosphate-mannose--protein O-mannosyl transferase